MSHFWVTFCKPSYSIGHIHLVWLFGSLCMGHIWYTTLCCPPFWSQFIWVMCRSHFVSHSSWLCHSHKNTISIIFNHFVRYCDGKKVNLGPNRSHFDFGGSSNMEELKLLMLNRLMIRRMKSEVLSQLPSKQVWALRSAFRQNLVKSEVDV